MDGDEESDEEIGAISSIEFANEAPQILDDIDLGFTFRAGKNSRVFCTANEAIIEIFNRNSQMTI